MILGGHYRSISAEHSIPIWRPIVNRLSVATCVFTPRCRPLRRSTNNIRCRSTVDDLSEIPRWYVGRVTTNHRSIGCGGRLSVTRRSIHGQYSTDTRPLPGHCIDRQSTMVLTAISVDTPHKTQESSVLLYWLVCSEIQFVLFNLQGLVRFYKNSDRLSTLNIDQLQGIHQWLVTL